MPATLALLAALLAAPPCPPAPVLPRLPRRMLAAAAIATGPRVRTTGRGVPFAAASLIKLGVAAAWATRLRAGLAGLGDSLVLADSLAAERDTTWFRLAARYDPDPDLHAQLGRPVPLAELLDRMLARSSNLATAQLIAQYGRAAMQATLDSLGFPDAVLLHNFGDRSIPGRNTITPSTAARLMLHLVAPRDSADSVTHVFRTSLGRQVFRGGIPAVIPASVNKTGTSGRTHHDVAAWRTRDGSWVALAVLTEGHRRERDAQRTMRRVAQRAALACPAAR